MLGIIEDGLDESLESGVVGFKIVDILLVDAFATVVGIGIIDAFSAVDGRTSRAGRGISIALDIERKTISEVVFWVQGKVRLHASDLGFSLATSNASSAHTSPFGSSCSGRIFIY